MEEMKPDNIYKEAISIIYNKLNPFGYKLLKNNCLKKKDKEKLYCSATPAGSVKKSVL